MLKPGCTSNVSTRNRILIAEPSQHSDNCFPDLASKIVRSKINDMKDMMRADTTPAKRVYDQVARTIIHELNAEERVSKMPRYESVVRTLYKARRSAMLALPQSIQDIELPHEFKHTNEGAPFLLADDRENENRILVFSTDRSIELLSMQSKWYCDGTFKRCPGLFAQMYTIHSMPFDGFMLPLVYALLPSKTNLVYRRLLTIILNSCMRFNQPNIQEIHIDFEESMRQAINYTFPLAAVKGCNFHFTQCIYRKVQELVEAMYRDDEK